MDDGIELNFAVSDGPKRAHVAKGGRWTDRAAARKTARHTVKEAARARDIVRSVPEPQSAPRTQAVPASRPVQLETTRLAVGEARQESAVARVPRTDAPPIATSSESDLARAVLESRTAPGPSRLQPTKPSTAAPTKGKAPQIISSLFSSNPSHRAPKSGPSTIGAPSNAPLRGDANTFAGLGVDPLLVQHLSKKMDLQAPTGIQRSALPYLLSAPLDINARATTPELDVEAAASPSSTGSPKGKERAIDTNGLRDVLIQSQTGSGKTLTYLLPIIQTLLPLSRLSYIDRSIGTLALILAPTRELALQISKVLDQLLSLSLSVSDADTDERYTRWLVSGLFTGGATKTHEKARLRKGVPIIVATPGRLLDHLQSTSSFQCGKTMFLVLDEADRLMDLGFEETINGIIKAIDGRRRLAVAAEKEMDEVGGGTMRWPFWDRGRTTVLCSATVDAKVEKLSGVALRDPIVFRSEAEVKEGDRPKKTTTTALSANTVDIPQDNPDKFTPPSQLSQKYIVTPTKLRLVALVALLRSLISASSSSGNKIIVFLSSTDTVDYHWKLLGGVRMDVTTEKPDISLSTITLSSPLFPKTAIQRLHGSLPLATRKASLAKFTEASNSPSILLATSVASRGLDLPLVRAVIQYDLPTEGGANEYVHRVGRTARAGKGGEAWAFVGSAEVGWVKWVEEKMGTARDTSNGAKSVRLSEVGVEEILRKGFGGAGYEYESRATDAQLAFERWVLADDSNAAMARKAFGSYMRAYSTHPLEEKAFFHQKSLHLGHLAKAFALRETPSALALGHARTSKASKMPGQTKRKREGSDDEDETRGGKEKTARNKTEERMYEAVRKAGRNVKSGGAMGEFSGQSKGRNPLGGEFQVMDGNEIERMLAGKR